MLKCCSVCRKSTQILCWCLKILWEWWHFGFLAELSCKVLWQRNQEKLKIILFPWVLCLPSWCFHIQAQRHQWDVFNKHDFQGCYCWSANYFSCWSALLLLDAENFLQTPLYVLLSAVKYKVGCWLFGHSYLRDKWNRLY